MLQRAKLNCLTFVAVLAVAVQIDFEILKQSMTNSIVNNLKNYDTYFRRAQSKMT